MAHALVMDMAGPGLKKIRIAHLPPEVSEQEIRVTLSKYGAVQEIQNEVWSRRYRYQVPTGVRIGTSSSSSRNWGKIHS